VGARALLAFRRGEESRDAQLGALLIADFFATFFGWAEGWVKVHKKK